MIIKIVSKLFILKNLDSLVILKSDYYKVVKFLPGQKTDIKRDEVSWEVGSTKGMPAHVYHV